MLQYGTMYVPVLAYSVKAKPLNYKEQRMVCPPTTDTPVVGGKDGL